MASSNSWTPPRPAGAVEVEALSPAPLERMLTTREVAEWLHLHRNTVERLVHRGELRAVRICRRGDYRFRLGDIEAYLRSVR